MCICKSSFFGGFSILIFVVVELETRGEMLNQNMLLIFHDEVNQRRGGYGYLE
jgi:hypothetical protein